ARRSRRLRHRTKRWLPRLSFGRRRLCSRRLQIDPVDAHPAISVWRWVCVLAKSDSSPHSLNQALELDSHRRRGIRLEPPAVAGENPAEGQIQQALHRTYLSGPGVPAHSSGGAEPTLGSAPEMITRKECVAVKQREAPARVTWDRNDEEIVV